MRTNYIAVDLKAEALTIHKTHPLDQKGDYCLYLTLIKVRALRTVTYMPFARNEGEQVRAERISTGNKSNMNMNDIDELAIIQVYTK